MVAAAVTARPAGRGGHRWAVVPLRAVAATAGGLLLYASFPPGRLWWLAPLGLALFAAAVHGGRARAGFGYGYLFALGFLLPLLVWTGSFVGWPWLFLPAFEGLFLALTGAALAVVTRLPGRLAPLVPVAAGAAWVAGEALRGRVPFGGFPWGRIAFGQPEGPLLPLAALGGAPL
ncbi:MAG TPA: apolipoprotein N-acyltransferase, partial [Pseudonocardiaceae bacterium]